MTSTASTENGAGMYQARRLPLAEDVGVGGLHYRVWRWPGQGARAVVLLHGWMDSGASFQFTVDALPEHWEIIAPDWRGFGQSDRAPEGYYFPDYLADLDAVLEHYYPDQSITLVGHSMGGNVAGLYAGTRPERIERLVSLEGFGLGRSDPETAPTRYADWLDSLKTVPSLREFEHYAALAAHLRRQNPRLTPERAAFIARCWGEPTPDGHIALRGDPRHKRPNPVLYRLDEAMACWRRITAPTLWLIGGESDVLHRSGAEADFRDRLACFRDIRVQEIPDAGHALHLDQPTALAERLIAFTTGQ